MTITKGMTTYNDCDHTAIVRSDKLTLARPMEAFPNIYNDH